jgi:excisionase family DNA binding protein
VEGCAPGAHESANVQEALISSRAQVARLPDAAHELGISLSTVRRLVKAGRLKTVSLGTRAVGITYAEISRFLAAQA